MFILFLIQPNNGINAPHPLGAMSSVVIALCDLSSELRLTHYPE